MIAMASSENPPGSIDRGWRRRFRRQKRGFNIIGDFTDTSGHAESTKSTARCVAAIGYPMNLVDTARVQTVDDGYRRNPKHQPRQFSVSVVHDNVFHALGDQEHYLSGRKSRLRTIGYWYWEISSLPSECSTAFDLVDEVWVPTRFVREALQPHTDKPVVVVPPSVDVHMSHPTGRARFNLPTGRFLFLTMASVHSVVERKNPLGVVEAFRQAFNREEDVGLVVKMTDRQLRPDVDAILTELAQRLPIFLIDERLSRHETLSLFDCCDCFVSLHRGEGFGFPLAEAMALGKPVIATAYSGNMDFTNGDNSYLVPFDLIELKEDLVVFPKGSTWAEPRTEEAIALMRSVVSDRDGRERVGRAGQEFVARRFAPSVGGDVIRDRMKHFETS
jgi:glycosyltransferase involved in cell wall biosynthesis